MPCLCLCSLWVSSAAVFPARAGNKDRARSSAPPLSRVASKVTGKVIDYTPCRADRARRAAHSALREIQKRLRAGRVGHSIPTPPTWPLPSLNLINFSWELSRSKRQRERLDEKGGNLTITTYIRHINIWIREGNSRKQFDILVQKESANQ